MTVWERLRAKFPRGEHGVTDAVWFLTLEIDALKKQIEELKERLDRIDGGR
jgi:hypothetical protein